eukprot:3649045-Pyramimonas_sp.AAC.1
MATLFVSSSETAIADHPYIDYAANFGYPSFSQAKGTASGKGGSLATYAANITTWNNAAKKYILDSRFTADFCVLTETHLTLDRHGDVRKKFQKSGWKTYVCPAAPTAQGSQGGILLGVRSHLSSHARVMGAKGYIKPLAIGTRWTSCIIKPDG